MSNFIKNWNYEQFLAFLLLYCSSSDYRTTKSEKDLIKMKSKNTDMNEIRDEFNRMSDYEIIQTILSFKEKYFSTDKAKQKIIKDIEEHFLADKELHYNEKNLCKALSELFNSLK